MGRTPLRIVSTLLMTVVLTVPVLGAVCGMLCERGTGLPGHRAHSAAAHNGATDTRGHGPHHGHSAGAASTVAQHHHGPSLSPVSDALRPIAEWNGRCCDQPTLTLAAIPIVRHELQIDPAVFDTVSLLLGVSDLRPVDPRRESSRARGVPRHSNPILRI